MKRIILTGMFSLLATTALANPNAIRTDLPPVQMVAKVLEESPTVQSAKSGIDLGKANKSKLDSGPHEFNASALGQQREVKSANDGKRNEWGFGIDRGIRMPGKWGLDSDIGDAGLDAAEFGYRDAYHEAARVLLSQWFDWVKAKAEVEQWRDQAASLGKQLNIVTKREKVGDAAKLEASMAEAASAQATSSLTQAEARLQIAESTLRQSYPGLVLPENIALIDPEPIQGGLEEWRMKIMTDNHELKRVQALTKQADLQASRARLDQIPDPTIGVQFGSEQGGDERYVGLRLSIPIPGTGSRGAEVDAARAQASMAAQQEALTNRAIMNSIAGAYAKAASGYSSWQSAKIANDTIGQNAEKMARAYELGEADLTDLLTAQRLRAESALTFNTTRIEAIEARYRLLLDSHQLWLPPGEEEEHGVAIPANAEAPAAAVLPVLPAEEKPTALETPKNEEAVTSKEPAKPEPLPALPTPETTIEEPLKPKEGESKNEDSSVN